MKQIALNGICELNKRIEFYVKAIKSALDPESLASYRYSLMIELARRRSIENRFRVKHNVIYVDFTNKKRKAA